MKIFILSDGTWLSNVSNLQSNIYKLKTTLENQDDCKVIYQSGIGTEYSFKFNPINLINAAFNWFDLLCFFVGGYKSRTFSYYN